MAGDHKYLHSFRPALPNFRIKNDLTTEKQKHVYKYIGFVVRIQIYTMNVLRTRLLADDTAAPLISTRLWLDSGRNFITVGIRRGVRRGRRRHPQIARRRPSAQQRRSRESRHALNQNS